MQTITIKDCHIGSGRPKIIIPLIGHNEAALFDEIENLPPNQFDVIEWRADYFNELNNIDKVVFIAGQLRKKIPTIPLLFTCRSKQQGGHQSLSDHFYYRLNHSILESGYVDLIDLEITQDNAISESLTTLAHNQQIFVIASYHNFHSTPSEQTIIATLCKMQKQGADILKIAVTPTSHADLITLILAANNSLSHYTSRPLVIIAMGELGKLSRVACMLFGSSLTFAYAKNQSSSGQIRADKLYSILSLVEKL